MLIPNFTNSFKKDFQTAEKRKRDMKSLEDIIQKLVSKKPLDAKHRDHVLKGDYVGFRECHIENDWLLIYKIKDGVIYFTRTGTHSDLFR